MLAGELVASGACGTDRFYCLVIRVQKTGEHLLPGKLTGNGACILARLHRPINRVQRREWQAHNVRAFALWQIDYQRRVRNWQISDSHQSGIEKRGSV